MLESLANTRQLVDCNCIFDELVVFIFKRRKHSEKSAFVHGTFIIILMKTAHGTQGRCAECGAECWRHSSDLEMEMEMITRPCPASAQCHHDDDILTSLCHLPDITLSSLCHQLHEYYRWWPRVRAEHYPAIECMTAVPVAAAGWSPVHSRSTWRSQLPGPGQGAPILGAPVGTSMYINNIIYTLFRESAS